MSDHGVSDEQWAEFVNNHRVMSGLPDPGRSAAATGAAAGAAGEPGRPERRFRPKAVAGAVVALLAVCGLAVYGVSASPKHAVSSPLVGGGAARAAAKAAPSVSAVPSGGASSSTLGVFLPQFGGYTLVADKALPSCVGRDTTGPTLAGLLTQSAGCTELDIALYKDAAGDQFNLALFRMKDPTDCPHIIDVLLADPTDYEVGAEVPPDGSGLRALPADSGMVQNFESYGSAVIVGLGQWADGHSGDFNTLVAKTQPVMDQAVHQLGGPLPPNRTPAPGAAPSTTPGAGGGPVQSV